MVQTARQFRCLEVTHPPFVNYGGQGRQSPALVVVMVVRNRTVLARPVAGTPLGPWLVCPSLGAMCVVTTLLLESSRLGSAV